MFRISELFGTFSELGTRNFKIASELLSERSEVPKVYCPLSELSELSEPDKVPKVPVIEYRLQEVPFGTSQFQIIFQCLFVYQVLSVFIITVLPDIFNKY